MILRPPWTAWKTLSHLCKRQEQLCPKVLVKDTNSRQAAPREEGCTGVSTGRQLQRCRILGEEVLRMCGVVNGRENHWMARMPKVKEMGQVQKGSEEKGGLGCFD